MISWAKISVLFKLPLDKGLNDKQFPSTEKTMRTICQHAVWGGIIGLLALFISQAAAGD